MQDFYTTPASKLNMTARELVMNRLRAVGRKMNDGKKIVDTSMLRAFIRVV